MSIALPPCSLPAFLVALRDGLRARPALAEAFVTLAPPPPDHPAIPTIVIGGTATSDQAIQTFGQLTVKEDYTIDARAWWIADGLAGDEAVEAALTGAFGLYAEVESLLRSSATAPRVGGAVMRAEAALTRYTPTVWDVGTGVMLEFQIRVQNELHP